MNSTKVQDKIHVSSNVSEMSSVNLKEVGVSFRWQIVCHAIYRQQTIFNNIT